VIELDVRQGSEAWLRARLGIPTASAFGRIITAKTLKPSAQAPKYLCEKLGERLTGFPADSYSDTEMDRGGAMEASAVAWYEFERGVLTRKSGLCLLNNRKAGASVDRFVGEDGILEVKCPMATQHLMALLEYDDAEHRIQCQGQLMITQRKWVDRLSYFPGLPPALHRFERDEEAISAIMTEVALFIDALENAQLKVGQMLAGSVAA
jgi:hypothetical protein